jgi:hypothetical protein
MKFIDDLIVSLALCLLRGVMTIGTWLVYVQFFVLVLLLATAGIVTFTVMVRAAKDSLL